MLHVTWVYEFKLTCWHQLPLIYFSWKFQLMRPKYEVEWINAFFETTEAWWCSRFRYLFVLYHQKYHQAITEFKMRKRNCFDWKSCKNQRYYKLTKKKRHIDASYRNCVQIFLRSLFTFLQKFDSFTDRVCRHVKTPCSQLFIYFLLVSDLK